MSTQWLAIQSFQHSQEVLAAINTLSIHLKLGLAGVPDEGRADAAQRSRETLATFFRELETVVQEAEEGATKPLVGTDPRTRQFARSFIAAKHDPQRSHSVLFHPTLSQAQKLLRSEKAEDQQALLQGLGELRALVEEHVDTDALHILWEI